MKQVMKHLFFVFILIGTCQFAFSGRNGFATNRKVSVKFRKQKTRRKIWEAQQNKSYKKQRRAENKRWEMRKQQYSQSYADLKNNIIQTTQTCVDAVPKPWNITSAHLIALIGTSTLLLLVGT